MFYFCIRLEGSYCGMSSQISTIHLVSNVLLNFIELIYFFNYQPYKYRVWEKRLYF